MNEFKVLTTSWVKTSLLFLIIFCSFLNSCNAQSIDKINFKEYVTTFDNKINLVKIDSINMNAYSLFHFNLNNDSAIIYNDKENKIYFYCYSSKKNYDSLTIPHNFEIISIYPINSDSIYLLSFKDLYLTDSKLNILSSYKIQKNTKGIYMTCLPYAHHFPFLVSDNNLFIENYNIDCSYDINECFNHNIECLFELESGKKKELNIKVSPLYSKGNYTSHIRDINRIKNGDNHIYHYKIDTNIYVYNIKSDSMNVKKCKASYDEGILPYTYDLNQKIDSKSKDVFEYFKTNSKYVHMIYDSYNNLYFRIYLHGQNLKNENNMYNEYLDRQTIILIYNDKFEKLAEIEIDTRKYNYDIISTPLGIAFPRRDLVNKKPQYDIYKVSFN